MDYTFCTGLEHYLLQYRSKKSDMTEGGIFESPLHVFKPPECMTVRSHHNAQLLWKTIIHGQVGRTVVRKYSPELCLPVWLQS